VTPKFFGARGSVRRLFLTVVLCVLSPTISAQEQPSPQVRDVSPKDSERDAKVFYLHLTAEQLNPKQEVGTTGFLLGLTDRSAAESQTIDRQPAYQLEFSLHTGAGGGDRSLPGIGLEFYDDLAASRWPGGKTRLETHLAAEYARVLEGGRVGVYGGDVGVISSLDLIALARLVVMWWQSHELRQLPAGASIPRDATLTLEVRDTGGTSPGHISVLPLTQGWIGDAVHARCDDRGRCVVEGLPSASSTLFVRGVGGSVVRWDHSSSELSVALRPTGWLRISPEQQFGVCCPVIRVLEENTDAIVPILRWINPDREDWVRVPRSGLTLTLPEGRYRIQTSRHFEGSFVEATVFSDRVSTVEVPSAPGP